MKRTFAMALAALSLLVSYASAAWAGEERVFPIPRYEAEQVIASWLKSNGYAVQRMPGPDEVRIRGTKKSLSWDVTCRHRSTLATQIRVNASPDGTGAALWEYLAGYLHTDARAQAGRGSGAIPPPVLARMDSVVCIRAEVKGEPIQLTGLVVDVSGLILCTAHTLVNPDAITIIPANGSALTGKILKIDFKKDLALIDCTHAFDSSVPLQGSVPVPGAGVRVYSVGCPLNLGGTLLSGVIEGKPVLVEGEPLLGVRMEIEPGSSGSPVFNANGTLVAMVKGRIKGDHFAGLLIPMETVLSFVKGK